MTDWARDLIDIITREVSFAVFVKTRKIFWQVNNQIPIRSFYEGHKKEYLPHKAGIVLR